jgi:tRNA-specific 2-thiouridylase
MSTKGGRTTFLGDRIPFHRAAVVDTSGARLGEVEAIELVTIGQRKGIGLPGGGPKRYVVDVDTATRVITVGDEVDMLRPGTAVHSTTWVDGPAAGDVLVQCSAHGEPHAARIRPTVGGHVDVRWNDPQRRVAPGQSVVFYDLTDTKVLGGGIAS